MTRRVLLLVALVSAAAVPTAAALRLALSDDDADAVVVLAPSSMAPVQHELDDAFEKGGLDAPSWVFAGSQSIVAQVADGAPADVVLTADRVSFDAARAAGADHPTEVSFATNHLVLAVSAGNPGRVDGIDALADDSLLIGLCAEVVPCGRLSSAALSDVGVDARPDTEETSVRALTTKLDTGELDAGLVYRSDALAAGLQTIDVPSLEAITTTYWGTAGDDGLAVLDLLTSAEAQAVLADAGFGP